MIIDPRMLVTVIENSGRDVYLSELNALVAMQMPTLGDTLKPADVTAGLRAAIYKGWLQSDGLRVAVASGGHRILHSS